MNITARDIESILRNYSIDKKIDLSNPKIGTVTINELYLDSLDYLQFLLELRELSESKLGVDLDTNPIDKDWTINQLIEFINSTPSN